MIGSSPLFSTKALGFVSFIRFEKTVHTLYTTGEGASPSFLWVYSSEEERYLDMVDAGSSNLSRPTKWYHLLILAKKRFELLGDSISNQTTYFMEEYQRNLINNRKWLEYPNSDVEVPKEVTRNPLRSNVSIKYSTFLTTEASEISSDIEEEITKALAKKITASMERELEYPIDYSIIKNQCGSFRPGELITGYSSGATIVKREPMFTNIIIENPGDMDTLKI